VIMIFQTQLQLLFLKWLYCIIRTKSSEVKKKPVSLKLNYKLNYLRPLHINNI
jgi:hypothetical protein